MNGLFCFNDKFKLQLLTSPRELLQSLHRGEHQNFGIFLGNIQKYKYNLIEEHGFTPTFRVNHVKKSKG